jgi:hypothetical protein
MLPTIWYTYMMLVTKYQIPSGSGGIINICSIFRKPIITTANMDIVQGCHIFLIGDHFVKTNLGKFGVGCAGCRNSQPTRPADET